MLSFILSIVYGAIAGWIASKIMNTQGGTLRNIITVSYTHLTLPTNSRV